MARLKVTQKKSEIGGTSVQRNTLEASRPSRSENALAATACAPAPALKNQSAPMTTTQVIT
jgi:hypothetical protein